MIPTPRERIDKALNMALDSGELSDYAPIFLDTMEQVVTSAIADQTAALQAALDDMAKAYSDLISEQIAHGKTMQERDGLAAALVETHGALEDMQRTTRSNTIAHELGHIIDDIIGTRGLNILAAHDRAVAARVLRDIQWTIPLPMGGHDLLELAAEYEAGTREVPGE